MPQGYGTPVELSVVVMAFNEAESLAAVVEEIGAVLGTVHGRQEIIIADDGSQDGTGRIADELSQSLPNVRVIHHDTNRGLGEVYRSGFASARGELITFFPADGQFPAAIIQQFIAVVMDGADLVLGYLRGRPGPRLSQGLSALEKAFYRVLFGPLPKFQGVLMFRRRLLEELELTSTGRGWAVLMELIIKASRGGYRIRSVPTAIRPRMSGASKVNNVPTIWANLKQVLALRRILSP